MLGVPDHGKRKSHPLKVARNPCSEQMKADSADAAIGTTTQLLVVGAFKHLLQHERDEHALGPKPKLLLKCCQSFIEADRKHDLQGDVRLFHGSWVDAASMPAVTASGQEVSRSVDS